MKRIVFLCTNSTLLIRGLRPTLVGKNKLNKYIEKDFPVQF